MSAIGYAHKLKAVPDPTSSFLILELLHACHKQEKRFDPRMPIVKPMLERLMLTLGHKSEPPASLSSNLSSFMPFWELEKLQSEEKIGTMLT